MFRNKYRYLFIPLLASYSYVNSELASVYSFYHINAPWYYILLAFNLITLGVWESNRVTGLALQKKLADARPARRLIIFFSCGVLTSTLLSLLIFFLVGIVILRMPTSETRIPIILILTYGTRINLFLHTLDAIFFYSSQLQTKQLEAEELKRINSQTQLQAIKNQINPHFLFNNLNVLSSLVMQENPAANQFIEQFSKVYRHILSTGDKELIPLIEELEFVDAYFYLLKIRFPGSIVFVPRIPPEFEKFLIVPVSLQMLVENAVKHNVASPTRPLAINVSVVGTNQLLVENNLQIKSQSEPSTETGLKNIAQRYELISRLKIEITKTRDSFGVLLPLIQPQA